MAKQQVVEFDNGATLIYQKQNVFNGCSFVVGFRSGARLDGKYKGLSHLLEHLLFRSTEDSLTENILNNILSHSINQNAGTTEDGVFVNFSATHNNVAFALDNCVRMLTNKKFSEEQIRKEAEIVKQEINMYKDQIDDSDYAYESLMNALMEDGVKKLSNYEILGSPKTLKSISPELLEKYVSRYFNLDNLVVSVTTNKSLNETINLCQQHIFSKLKRAKDTSCVIPYKTPDEYKNINGLVAIPNREQQNVEINVLLRERTGYSENIDKEFAYDMVEEYMMNNLGGILWDVLRVKNNLVYSYSLQNTDMGTAKFKVFNAITSGSKMRKTISEICKTIRNIATNGFPEEMFETVIKTLTDQQNASLQKFKSCSALGNYMNFMNNIQFVDYKKVISYIQSMTYEDFNKHICDIYCNAQVSLSAYGNFDRRKMYYLVEVEQMLGNQSHAHLKDAFNASPIAEMTEITECSNCHDYEDEDDEYFENDQQAGKFSQQPITIDDQPIR